MLADLVSLLGDKWKQEGLKHTTLESKGVVMTAVRGGLFEDSRGCILEQLRPQRGQPCNHLGNKWKHGGLKHTTIGPGSAVVGEAAREKNFSRTGAGAFWDNYDFSGGQPCNSPGQQMEARGIAIYNDGVQGTLWLWRRLARRTFRA